MKYPEEAIAIDLQGQLTRRFQSTQTSVTVEGAGVHWRCTVIRGVSECSIACFNSRSPEYYTEFIRHSAKLATARTPSRDHTIDAVVDWLDGVELQALHSQYYFVDETKRALSQVRDDVLAILPDLAHATDIMLKHLGADIFSLRFVAVDRSCEISYDRIEGLPDAKFSWDDCQLFRFQADDYARLALVLDRWLCDRVPPSAMRQEFEGLEIGELADYYESGNPIEGEFKQSWDFIETFYQEDWCKSDDVQQMIQVMRRAGYDRLLRAGQSMSSLGLSRSRRHGLRSGQVSIFFEFHKNLMDVHAEFAGGGLKNHPIQFTSDVQRLLDALVKVDIN